MPKIRHLIALLSALAGCSGSRDTSANPVPRGTEISNFSASSPLRDSVILKGQDSVPVVRYSGLAASPTGELVLVDVSEGHVLFYDSTGTLLRVVGKKGRGPGEFTEPRYVGWNARRQLFVGEGNGRVSIFSERGDYVRSFQMQALGISSLSVTEAGEYLVTTFDNPTGILLLVDSVGAVLRRFIPRKHAPVIDQPTHPLWKMVTQYWHVAKGDTAYVFATVSDSMWTVDLRSGSVMAHHIKVPDYNPPKIPEKVETDRAKMFAWIADRSMAQGAWIDTDGTVGISYVRGTLAYGDSAVLMVRRRDGVWMALQSASPVYGTTRASLLGILHPGTAVATLGLWEKPW